MYVSSRTAILHVGNFLSSRGYNRTVIEELADRLELAGWGVYRTSTVLSRPIRLATMAGTIWLKRRQFSVGNIDVFSGPAFVWAEVASWAMRRVGRPYVLTLRGGDLPAFAQRWPNRTRRLLDSAADVVTLSPYLLKQMSTYRRDLLLVPNPIDLSRYAFRLRQQPQPKLIWMRAFHETYNPSLAPRVLALLARDFPNLHLTMIGPDKGDGSWQKTQQCAISLGISDRLSLPGAVAKTEVSDWLNKGDIFLNTTNVDNTPVSVLEAMACGLCVVSTNVGGIPYLLEHEHDALLVSADDPEAMAAAVSRILKDTYLAEQLSLNAHKKVAKFDWSVILPRWESLLKAIEIRHRL